MSNEYFTRLLTGLSQQLGFSMDAPWERLPAKVQKAVLHGSPDQVHVRYKNRYGRERSYYAAFEGVLPFLERRHEDTDSDYMRDKYEGYMRDVPCPVCHGTRLKPEILAVKLNGRSIAEVTNLSIGDASRVAGRPGAGGARAGDRRPRAQRDPGPAVLPGRRRPRLPVPRPAGRDARRWRGAAHPAGHPDRLRAWSASSTCSTSPRSGCTSATTAG